MFEVVTLLTVLGLVLCSCSRMVMLFVLYSVAWIALEVYLGERRRYCDFLHWFRFEMFDGLTTAAVFFFS